MYCLQSSTMDKMCNCLFPDFPLCTDTTELCLNNYLLLLPVVGVLLSLFLSLVTPISSEFGLKAVRIPCLLLWWGQCVRGAGAEGSMGRRDIQEGHLLPVSLFPFCSLSSEGNLCFSEPDPCIPTVSLRGYYQCSRSAGNTSQDVPWYLAEIICSFLPFHLLKHHVLSSHTPPRQ